MTNELKDFIHFKENQLFNIDFLTGKIDVLRECTNPKTGVKYKQRRTDVGSLNSDGYVRLWCNKSLRMKHRLIYWLFYNEMPIEVDHIDKNRSNNAISNLRSVSRTVNVQGTLFKGRRIFSEQEVHKICELLSQKSHSQEQIAKMLKCSRMAIQGISSKRRHSSIADLYF